MQNNEARALASHRLVTFGDILSAVKALFDWLSSRDIFHRYSIEILFLAISGFATASWAGLKKWRTHQLENWPTVLGRIEEITVCEGKGFRVGSNKSWDVDVRYKYSLSGIEYSAVYRRAFEGELEAWDFAEGLDEKTVQVHYPSDRPEKSVLLEPELQSLIESFRATQYIPNLTNSKVEPLIPFLRFWRMPLMAFAGIGFAASLYVLVRAGQGEKFGPGIFVLHALVFAAFFPAVWILVSVGKKLGNSRDAMKQVFSLLPARTKYVAVALAVVAFACQFLVSGMQSSSDLIGFASTWMIFYGASFFVFWSTSQIRVTISANCTKGHESIPGSRRCTVCGRPLWKIIRDTPMPESPR